MTSNEALILDKYSIGEKSAVGDPRRRYEDRARSGLVQSHLGQLVVGIVADGVGSADFGGNAAQIAVDTTYSVLETSQAQSVPEMLDEAIRAANQAVNDQNARSDGDGQSTLVVAVIKDDRVFIGNVGDSRAYWVQSTGKMVQLTQDHNYYHKYGGDPNAEGADAVVNAIGFKETVGVDLGFYFDDKEKDKKRAFSMGMAGLPLKDGDSILLCSDGLIKNNMEGKRFATDTEIVEAIQSEFAPSAVVKMVGYAEGRKVDDNVSAVLIQRLSHDRIAQMEHRKAAVKRSASMRKIMIGGAIGLLVVGLGFSANALIKSQRELSEAQNATPLVIQITNTPMPSPTPTIPIDPGKARVDEVNGKESAYFTPANGQAGVLSAGQYIDPGTTLVSADGDIRVVIGELTGKPSLVIVLPMSTTLLNFGEKLSTDLTSGWVFIQPGVGRAEVHLPEFGDALARVQDADGGSGTWQSSRMVVKKLSDTQVMVMCFEGECDFRLPNAQERAEIPEGEKRIFDLVGGTSQPGETMPYEEMWEVNLACSLCMSDLIPAPTPTAAAVTKSATDTPSDDGSGKARKTSTSTATTVPTHTNTPLPTNTNTAQPTMTETVAPSATITPTKTPKHEPTNTETKIPPTESPTDPTESPVPNPSAGYQGNNHQSPGFWYLAVVRWIEQLLPQWS